LHAVALLLLPGCFGGSNVPELAKVSGTITMDGKPLPDATVTFFPQSLQGDQAARPATGATDESGHYELHYSTTESGARPGQYKVAVSTYRPEGEDRDGNEVPGSPETVPGVYNTQTTLSADVKVDGSPLDFKLQSNAGPVIQPPSPSEDTP
jgi:hypothetical protein